MRLTEQNTIKINNGASYSIKTDFRRIYISVDDTDNLNIDDHDTKLLNVCLGIEPRDESIEQIDQLRLHIFFSLKNHSLQLDKILKYIQPYYYDSYYGVNKSESFFKNVHKLICDYMIININFKPQNVLDKNLNLEHYPNIYELATTAFLKII